MQSEHEPIVPKQNIHEDDRPKDLRFATTNHPEFTSYYENQSIQENVINNIKNLKRVLLGFYRSHSPNSADMNLTILDVGCGAGTQAMIWAEDGHHVYGIDISERLIKVGRERMAQAGVVVDFEVGSSTQLPLPSEKVDICLVPELLEHVREWSKTLEECCRVLKPGGMLYISTSNALCPLQSEFNLPLYSWYPGFIKRICEKKAVTTHPQWVNYATYPAVNWFTNPVLAKTLNKLGFKCYDRFDIMDLSNKPVWAAWLVSNLLLRFRIARYFAYMLDRSTILVSIKNK